ncbi:efflux transporter outer membrane subunit [Pseudomonas fluorescens]|nr:efflux transporter outer membrane subunit [Pseudomonas fluorescens]
MHKINALTSAVVCALALSACSMAPVYERPAAPVPSEYPQSSTPSLKTEASLPDWESFVQLAPLRALVASALTHNRDLRQALLNVETARAQYGIERADRLPSINANGALDRQRIPEQLSPTQQGGVQSTYRADVGLNAFEIDLFGRVRNLSDAALQEYLTSEQAARTVRITLIASVSEAYLRYTAAQARMSVTQQTLSAREKSLELVQMRGQVGSATELDTQEAIGLLEQARIEQSRTQRESLQARYALQLLVGEDELNANLIAGSTDDIFFQDVEAGLPSNLLSSRPDILGAEHRIQARNANIGAARAAFFPRITLTGNLGTAGPELSDLFSAGSRTWQFLPQVSLPIFSGGRNQANLDLANLRKESSIVEYEKAIQTAFTEVADALASRTTLQQQLDSQKKLVATSERTLSLAELRYRSGVDSHLRYLDAQRGDFSNRLTLIDTWQALQVSRIQLYKSLGGSENQHFSE